MSGGYRRQLLRHMGGAFVVVVVTGIQKVGKEKKFQYEKDDEKFYQNNRPQRFARRHGAEPVEIKIKDAGNDVAAP